MSIPGDENDVFFATKETLLYTYLRLHLLLRKILSLSTNLNVPYCKLIDQFFANICVLTLLLFLHEHLDETREVEGMVI